MRRRWPVLSRLPLVVALAVVVVGGASSSCLATRPPPVSEPHPQAGADDRLTAKVRRFADEGMHDFASDRGNVVLIDVWATWCEPCRDALPLWQEVQKEYAGRGLKVYALTVDEDRNQVQKFLDDTGLTLPVLWDPEQSVVGPVLPVNVMPTTFLLDRTGKVRFVHAGFASEQLTRYQADIEQLLDEPVEGR